MAKNNRETQQTSYGKKRRYKIGALAAVTTVLVIVAILLVNYFVDYLSNRFMLEIDMTENSLYEISDETAQTLRNLKEHVTIHVMCPETNYESNSQLNQIREVLRRYEILSEGNVDIDYIDPNSNPQLYEKYNSLGDISTGDLIVESDRRYKHLTPSNLYTLETSDDGNTYITGLRAEQRLTSAILYVVSEKVPQAAYITGHGETTSLESFETVLTNSNYEIQTISLMGDTDEIPDDVDLIIISQPTADYTDAEIDKIDAFLNNGGNAIVSYAINTPTLENLERYFEEWGVEISNELIFDPSQCLSGYINYLLPSITTVDGLTDSLSTSMRAVIAGARPINTLFETNSWRGTQVLMTTSSSAYAKSMEQEIDAIEMSEEDVSGPFNVMVMAYQSNVDTSLNQTNSYVLFTNAGFLSDSTLGEDAFLNSKYLLTVMNFVSEDEDAIIIDDKDYTTDTLVLAGWQKSVLFWLLLIIIPVGSLAAGFIVWARRRHM
jgi:ABC-type uncharacterized transport system involved in gliding motility auxiliary subunit